ncbi:hypothetical protein [Pseudoalteromonas xiamenensis]|uniref:hypothetical protein n=1 Tax=Pseudoalteromonas xiamenensis TaxID=882626 RepID=UPI001FCC1BD3|nr:hypothetical protein [Pseudoalteromonas xiamenensis]
MASISAKLTESVIKSIPLEITRVTDTELSGFYLNVGKPNKDGKRSLVYYLYYRIGGRELERETLSAWSFACVKCIESKRVSKTIYW